VSAPILDEVDAPTREILERYDFDPELFGELRRRVASGELSPRTNTLSDRVEPLPVERLTRLPEPGTRDYERAREAGESAIAAGSVVSAVLGGGMATRFGGVVKGLAEAFDGHSFLDLKLADAARAGTPLVVMTSFATDAPTRERLADADALVFAQSVSLRLEPDGALFREPGGAASPYSPGHGDFPDSLRRSGALAELRSRGVRTLMLANVDNLGARVDPVVVGAHLLAGRPLTAEVAAKQPGDVGGGPALVGGRPRIVEGLLFPPSFDQDASPVFSTNTLTIELDALERSGPLSWLYVEKDVDGRRAVQLERIVNELTAFIPTTFLEVPRAGEGGRFFPVKTPEDLEAIRPALRGRVGDLLQS
jgi:UTP--glucose-1-phosphate uridylyltransferase